MLPNLIIIGAEKAGTSSLHYYLNFHPDIHMSRQKELNFFNEDLSRRKGLKWYERQFSKRHKINGEASPHYTRYPWEKGVPQYMHEIIPEAKLVYILRDPVERVLSAYFNEFCGAHENRLSLEEAFEDLQKNRYVDVSRYYFQLQQYLPYYPLKRILILKTEDLRDRRVETLKKVFCFLGVDEDFECKKFARMLNTTKKKYINNRTVKPGWILRRFLKFLKICLPRAVFDQVNRWVEQATPFERPPIPEQLRERLKEALCDDVRKLRELTGMLFSEWSV